MFSWSADTVRFMADACRRTDFHEKLTALLLPYLKPTDHICDAGCGLGYLSLALSPHAARVTAAEGGGQYLLHAAEKAEHHGDEGYRRRIGQHIGAQGRHIGNAPGVQLLPQDGQGRGAALRQCRGTVLAVVRDDVCHRFSGAPRAPGRHSFDAACGVLDAHGIPYTAQRAALDFPQPFRTLEDARTFLALYGGGAPAEDDLRAKLISTGDPDFPWQLPGVRRFGMIAFSTEEGEHI